MSEKSASVGADARKLYTTHQHGILSTMSLEIPGHPFGSVVSYALARDGKPTILISDIAEHTKNIQADPRCSLTVSMGGDDPQAVGRITIVGKAVALTGAEGENEAMRYDRRYPAAAEYRRAHDFTLYKIEPVKVRYIGGFGRIHWVESADFCRQNPFSETEEAAMVNHMNEDHADAMVAYCRMFNIDMRGDRPVMSAVDADGFDLRLGKRLARIAFDSPVATATDVRMAMVALVRRAKAAEPQPA